MQHLSQTFDAPSRTTRLLLLPQKVAGPAETAGGAKAGIIIKHTYRVPAGKHRTMQ